MIEEVSLEKRRWDYREAEAAAVAAAERYVEAKAGDRVTKRVTEEMDQAELELRRAKRRLEDTERRLRRR